MNLSYVSSDLKNLSHPPEFMENWLNEVDLCAKEEFFAETYNRVVIYEDDVSELVLCCWGPGHETPVHFHPNRGCWFRCLKGNLGEVKEDVESVLQPGEWGYVDDKLGCHKMVNRSEGKTVSLHYYRDLDI